MTGIQYTALSTIGARKGISSAELSRRFFVTPQTMNPLIAGLERRRLILRREDPANRRILKMRLTASGRRLLAACDAIADRVEAEIFGALSPEEYEALRAITRRIARDVREADARRKVDGPQGRTPGVSIRMPRARTMRNASSAVNSGEP